MTKPNLIANCFAKKSISAVSPSWCLHAEMWICAVKTITKLWKQCLAALA